MHWKCPLPPIFVSVAGGCGSFCCNFCFEIGLFWSFFMRPTFNVERAAGPGSPWPLFCNCFESGRKGRAVRQGGYSRRRKLTSLSFLNSATLCRCRCWPERRGTTLAATVLSAASCRSVLYRSCLSRSQPSSPPPPIAFQPAPPTGRFQVAFEWQPLCSIMMKVCVAKCKYLKGNWIWTLPLVVSCLYGCVCGSQVVGRRV